jgi:hypothetical protein
MNARQNAFAMPAATPLRRSNTSAARLCPDFRRNRSSISCRGVATHADGAHTIEPLTGLGYEYKGENGIPGRYYFDLRYEQRVVVHVHLFEVNTENWLRHLLFRDYLRVHADIAGQYASLKRDLALRYRHERAAYTDAKSEFISDVVVLARAERQMPSPGDVIALC